MKERVAQMSDSTMLPFEGCRILDLTADGRMLCGKILADLGADVIIIEPPGGTVSGRTAPFYEGKPDPENSLFWFSLNTNKRSITLNLQTPEGKSLFARLVESADIIIESFKPGYLAGLGFGYADLCKLKPTIIVTSISDFGQDGPYRDFASSDLVLMALSGYLYLCGDEDRPPVRMSLPQAYFHAGAEAAAATAMACYHLEMTGEGQHIDVSAQESLMWLLMQAQSYWDLSGINIQRVGSCWITAATGNRSLLNWECKDGFVTHLVMGGAEAKRAKALVSLMKQEGMAPDFLETIDWENFFDLNVLSQEDIDRVSEPFSRFFKAYGKEELFTQALEREIMLFPVSNVKDALSDPHLSARNFWVEIEHEQFQDPLKYPGPFAKFSETPLKKFSRAPRIGEHNPDIYTAELGVTAEQLKAFREKGVI